MSTSLRTTIAVFLRHAEKRHNDALAKEAKEKGTIAQVGTGSATVQKAMDTTVKSDDNRTNNAQIERHVSAS